MEDARIQRIREFIAPFRVAPSSDVVLGRDFDPASTGGLFTEDQSHDLLKTGVSARGAVYGPMAEVIYNSLQYLTDADIQAMAVYLKSLAQGSPPAPATSNVPSAEGSLLLALGNLVSVAANPGYYQSNAVAILGDGEQYGYVYSPNVYIPQ